MGVDRTCLVEDEVADAVEDRFAFIALRGLERMGVVTDEGIRSAVDEFVCLHPLLGNGLGGVFSSPMQTDDDHTSRMFAFQCLDALTKFFDCHLAHAGPLGEKGKVLQSHLNGGDHEYFSWFVGKKDRLLSLFLVVPCTNVCHPGSVNVADGAQETFASLVYAVIVSKVAMGDAVLVENRKPRWFSTKVKMFVDRCFDFGSGTFKVGNDKLTAAEKGVDTRGKEVVDGLRRVFVVKLSRSSFYELAHSTIQ